jgi:uncharacterized membrane protein YhaH (DUF805 family)
MKARPDRAWFRSNDPIFCRWSFSDGIVLNQILVRSDQWVSPTKPNAEPTPMSVFNSLFSVKGRIGRKTYWLACLSITGLVAAAILGERVVTGQLVIDPLYQPKTVFSAIALIASQFPLFVIISKRVNDINGVNDIEWPAWLFYATGVVSAVLLLAQYLGFNPFIKLTVVETVLVVLTLLVGLKRGTNGANAHGPDPLSVI